MVRFVLWIKSSTLFTLQFDCMLQAAAHECHNDSFVDDFISFPFLRKNHRY